LQRRSCRRSAATAGPAGFAAWFRRRPQAMRRRSKVLGLAAAGRPLGRHRRLELACRS
jgi:hypothetical protein